MTDQSGRWADPSGPGVDGAEVHHDRGLGARALVIVAALLVLVGVVALVRRAGGDGGATVDSVDSSTTASTEPVVTATTGADDPEPLDLAGLEIFAIEADRLVRHVVDTDDTDVIDDDLDHLPDRLLVRDDRLVHWRHFRAGPVAAVDVDTGTSEILVEDGFSAFASSTPNLLWVVRAGDAANAIEGLVHVHPSGAVIDDERTLPGFPLADAGRSVVVVDREQQQLRWDPTTAVTDRLGDGNLLAVADRRIALCEGACLGMTVLVGDPGDADGVETLDIASPTEDPFDFVGRFSESGRWLATPARSPRGLELVVVDTETATAETIDVVTVSPDLLTWAGDDLVAVDSAGRLAVYRPDPDGGQGRLERFGVPGVADATSLVAIAARSDRPPTPRLPEHFDADGVTALTTDPGGTLLALGTGALTEFDGPGGLERVTPLVPETPVEAVATDDAVWFRTTAPDELWRLDRATGVAAPAGGQIDAAALATDGTIVAVAGVRDDSGAPLALIDDVAFPALGAGPLIDVEVVDDHVVVLDENGRLWRLDPASRGSIRGLARLADETDDLLATLAADGRFWTLSDAGVVRIYGDDADEPDVETLDQRFIGARTLIPFSDAVLTIDGVGQAWLLGGADGPRNLATIGAEVVPVTAGAFTQGRLWFIDDDGDLAAAVLPLPGRAG